jgi:hypothetical protein
MDTKFEVRKTSSGLYFRKFFGDVILESYLDSWSLIIDLMDNEVDNLVVVTDYTNGIIRMGQDDFSIISNYMRCNLSGLKRMTCAAITDHEENILKLALWKEELVMHGVAIYGRIFGSVIEVEEFLGEKVDGSIV